MGEGMQIKAAAQQPQKGKERISVTAAQKKGRAACERYQQGNQQALRGRKRKKAGEAFQPHGCAGG